MDDRIGVFVSLEDCSWGGLFIPVGFGDMEEIQRASAGDGLYDWFAYDTFAVDYTPVHSRIWPSWWGDRHFAPEQFLGVLEDSGEYPGPCHGTVSDDWIAPFILGAKDMQFFPRFESTSNFPASLPPGSIGAAILQNLANDASDQRLDRQLLKEAQAVAEEGLEYHRLRTEFYRDRLSSL